MSHKHLKLFPNTEQCQKFLSGNLKYRAVGVPEKWGVLIVKTAEFAKSFSLKGVFFLPTVIFGSFFFFLFFSTDIVIVWNGKQGRSWQESLNTEIISLEWDKSYEGVPAPIKIADCVWITENLMKLTFCYWINCTINCSIITAVSLN